MASEAAGPQAALCCWVLSDGAPGHLSQSQGIVDAISRHVPVTVCRVDLRVRRRWLKSISRWLPGKKRADWLLGAVYEMNLSAGRPDFVVSSGGNTLLANALLGRRYGVPNFYSGTAKGFDPDWYARIFSVTAQGGAGNVVLPLPPVPGALCGVLPVTPADGPLALLIGGDGGGMVYQSADWQKLASQVNLISQRTGRKWLIGSSRRTGAAAEQLLASVLEPAAVERCAWWSADPQPVVRDFLGRAAAVYVTADSLTMIAEAIYSTRPVYVVLPELGCHDRQDAQALAGYEDAGFVSIGKMSAMNDMSQAIFSPAPVPDVQRLIWDSVRELL